MTQIQRLRYLISYLLGEDGTKADIPDDERACQRLFRALVNVRAPKPIGEHFLRVQDEYLQERLRQIGITDISKLSPAPSLPDIYLWQGDITTLKCDGIVNAANSRMLGCFCPNHGCIDNAVHTFAGVQLRQECAEIMAKQGHEERTGGAKITRGYNLPCKYVLHTVGPIVYGGLTKAHENQLIGCYNSCLELADKNELSSLAFCCISTGEFRFPADRAAELAVETVAKYKIQTDSKIKIVFNVFKDSDYKIYSKLLYA